MSTQAHRRCSAEPPLSSVRVRTRWTCPTSRCSLYPQSTCWSPRLWIILCLLCSLGKICHVTESVWGSHAMAGAHAAKATLQAGSPVTMIAVGTAALGYCLTTVTALRQRAQHYQMKPAHLGTSEPREKERATVWGQEAPEQLTLLFSPLCPHHTLTEGLSVLGYDLVTHFPCPPPTCCLPPSTAQSFGPRPAPPQHSN